MKRYLAVTIAIASLACAAERTTAQSFTFTSALRPGVTCPINVEILANPNAGPDSTNALFVPGLGHDANAMKPMIGELFAGTHLKNAILLHLPGRGGSGYPSGELFGNLTIDDYAAVLIQTLQQCNTRSIAAKAVVPHSMSGLVVERAAMLTSLTGLGVNRVIGFSIAAPAEGDDTLLDIGGGLFLLDQYHLVKTNAVEGTFIQATPYQFVGLFITDKNQQPVAGTPPPGLVTPLKSDESYAVTLQTIGTKDMRPSVSSGVFSGLSVRMIVGSQDLFTDANEYRALYEYLTGDPTDAGVVNIDDPSAVHDLFITIPGVAADATGLK